MTDPLDTSSVILSDYAQMQYDLEEARKQRDALRSVAEQYRENSNDQFHRANHLQSELEEANRNLSKQMARNRSLDRAMRRWKKRAKEARALARALTEATQ